MRQYDLSPLFRSTIGFDRLSRALDAAMRVDEAALSYPPYNIEKLSEDDYRITMAVAGFGRDDVEIVAQDATLTVRGKARQDNETATYLYRGIAGRAFERKFQLADHIEVVGAGLADGMLHIDLRREIPEAMKPRTVPIRTQAHGQVEIPRKVA
ncbi:MAG: Hsp20 family protein [Rhodospirillaceae bacterium]|nr:Hsp20 family protein [Rhodospirillaceae bacterium]